MISNSNITLAAAYVTSDGKKFHDLPEAQDHTRDQNLKARYSRLLRDAPEFAVVQPDVFLKLMRVVAIDAAAILTEPLEPISAKTGKPIDTRLVGKSQEHASPYRPSNGDPTRADALGEAMRRADQNERAARMASPSASATPEVPTPAYVPINRDDDPKVNRDVAQRAAV